MNSTFNLCKAAEYWQALPNGKIQCGLCPHRCMISEGHFGRCRVRGVFDGALRAVGYGILSSVHVDPVEKKPLYHFYPGSPIFSVGGWGCNFGCVFCQNWTISQDFHAAQTRMTPEQIVEAMKREQCSLMAYTYNEPLVGFEFVRDCSRLVRAAGGKNVLVTNGYCEPAPAAELLPMIDALNVDIKSMDESFYREQCKGGLAPVLALCKQARQAGCHLEITNLVIPGLNDSEAGFKRLAEWIRDELGPATPLHLSAYHPDYRMQIPATPAATLMKGYEISRQALMYVYMGNLITRHGQDTVCPSCGKTMIQRIGYETRVVGVRHGQCTSCGGKADIIGV